MTDKKPADLIREVAEMALLSAEQLVTEWLPDGRRQGREWIARNEVRGDRASGSFGINLDTGRWNDFADSTARGGDLVALLAYLRGCRQIEAAIEVDQRLALGLMDGRDQDPEATREREILQQQRLERKKAADRLEADTKEAKQKNAAFTAARLWKDGRPAVQDHAYLESKRVPPYHLRQLRGGVLLVPLLMDGRLANLQMIDGYGSKRFLIGGRVKGCYSPIGDISEGCTLYICEGWATGATIHADTGSPVACAMSAINLKPVALAFRKRYGDSITLIIAGDDDRRTAGNPGRTAANHAANAAGALVVFPEWPDNAPEELADFNDLHQWQAGSYRQRGGQ